MSKEETQPLWLSSENDHLHKSSDEAEPLFGTGKISLSGEVAEDDPPPADIESYGSIKDPPPEDKASVASSSKGSKKKKQPKKKARPAPPPSSIFDEDTHDEEAHVDDDSSVTEDDSKITMALDTKPHLPNRNWCLEFFRIFSAVTVIASLGLLATQLIPLFLGGIRAQGYFDLALKVYVTLFCFVFVFVEVDAPIPFVRNSQLLQTYIPRGFVYSFLGLICLEEAYSERVKEIVSTHADEFHVAWASLFMQISAWLVFGCGVGYMLMGVCCLKKVRDRMREKDRRIWRRYRRELKEWKRVNAL